MAPLTEGGLCPRAFCACLAPQPGSRQGRSLQATEVRAPLRERGAGFIPQERQDRIDAHAKTPSLLRLATRLRTEVRAPAAGYTPLAGSRCHANRSYSSRRRALLQGHSRGSSTNFAFVGFCS